jgi:hypothetical protein
MSCSMKSTVTSAGSAATTPRTSTLSSLRDAGSGLVEQQHARPLARPSAISSRRRRP